MPAAAFQAAFRGVDECSLPESSLPKGRLWASFRSPWQAEPPAPQIFLSFGTNQSRAAPLISLRDMGVYEVSAIPQHPSCPTSPHTSSPACRMRPLATSGSWINSARPEICNSPCTTGKMSCLRLRPSRPARCYSSGPTSTKTNRRYRAWRRVRSVPPGLVTAAPEANRRRAEGDTVFARSPHLTAGGFPDGLEGGAPTRSGEWSGISARPPGQ